MNTIKMRYMERQTEKKTNRLTTQKKKKHKDNQTRQREMDTQTEI